MTFKLYCFLQWCLQPITDLRLTILIPLLSHQLHILLHSSQKSPLCSSSRQQHPSTNIFTVSLSLFKSKPPQSGLPGFISTTSNMRSPSDVFIPDPLHPAAHPPPLPETEIEMNQWFLPTSQWSPPYLDKNGVQSHFWGLFRHQATEQLQSHVHFPTHTAAHVGYQGTHHFLRWQKAEENFQQLKSRFYPGPVVDLKVLSVLTVLGNLNYLTCFWHISRGGSFNWFLLFLLNVFCLNLFYYFYFIYLFF